MTSKKKGEYNSPWVSVYVTLEGVGDVKDQVACDFTRSSFDLKVRAVHDPPRTHTQRTHHTTHTHLYTHTHKSKVHGLRGQNFRLLKDALDKDIVPQESKVKVKGNRVTVQMKKVRSRAVPWRLFR